MIGYTEGQCSCRDRWQIRNWMKGGNGDDMHVGIDCSGFVYRVLDEAAVMSGAPPLSQSLGTACEYTSLDALTPANQVLHRAMDVQSGDTMRFNRGHHSGVIIETVTDGQGILKEIWYAHSSFTRGPHIGGIEVQDPEAPIEDAAQQWHDDMWDWLENNRLRDMYFESVHHSPFYQGARPRPAKQTGVTIAVGGSRIYFNVQPYIIGGRTMAQVRPLVDAMGASLDWDDNSQTITLTRGSRTVRCQVGSEVGVINDNGQLLDEPPILVDEQVVAPVRFLAEGLGYQTDWDAAQRYVTLTSM